MSTRVTFYLSDNNRVDSDTFKEMAKLIPADVNIWRLEVEVSTDKADYHYTVDPYEEKA